jgi:predicted DNA-binding transcriptional regulator AlpA
MQTTIFRGSAEPYVAAEDIAELFGVKKITILRWARKDPRLKRLRLPGVVKFRMSDVEAWLQTQEGK